MKKWWFYDDLWTTMHVSKAGNTRFVVLELARTKKSGERELARFKTNEEALAFRKGVATLKMKQAPTPHHEYKALVQQIAVMSKDFCDERYDDPAVPLQILLDNLGQDAYKFIKKEG